MHDSSENALSDPPTISCIPEFQALRFVTIANPADMQSKAQRKTIRSHVAQLQHSATSKEQKKRAALDREYKRRKARKTQVLLELEVVDTSYLPTKYSQIINSQLEISEVLNSQSNFRDKSNCSFGLADRILGGGHIDPFKTYPLPFEPFIPRVIHHNKLSRISDYSFLTIAIMLLRYTRERSLCTYMKRGILISSRSLPHGSRRS